jgi:NAD/NADP transhydrogenase alpha subunit
METSLLLLLLFILAVCLFLGFEVAAKTPAALRLSFLSGLNLFSGVIVLVAILAAGLAYGKQYDFAALLGGFAVAFAAAAATGGWLFANREPDDKSPKKEG